MKKLQTIIFSAIALLALINTACIEDGFTTSSNDTLAFSCDTLTFDTIFTEVGTSTLKFTVYNRHKKMINISSIRLKGNTSGKFSLNVDGEKGEVFNNVEIRGNDSIFVFVEAYLNPDDHNSPIEVSDELQFVTNGVAQSVVVTAWAQNVTRLYGEEITADTHLTADRPYVVFDSLIVAKNATLTIDAGATLYFHDKAFVRVDGTLKALGSQLQPVKLRGDRTDKVFTDVSYDIMSGQWQGIKISAGSFGNELQYVTMQSSSWGVAVDSTDVSQRALHIFNSVLHNASESVLTAKHAWIEAEGTEFSDAGSSVVNLTGGKISMAQCTFANYYLFSAVGGPIIQLGYLMPEDQKDVTLMAASFNNCVIYGNSSDVNPGDLTGSSVYFRHCLLKSKGSDDSNFINCKWGGDPLFYTVRADYLFDYRLKNKSDAIAIGDRNLCPASARYDRLGIDRMQRDGIDLGAYTWVEANEE